MDKLRLGLPSLTLMMVTMSCGSAIAQTAGAVSDPGHPRVNEVQQRVDSPPAP